MDIHLICVGQKMPDWVETGYQEYAKRLPASCSLKLHEVPLKKRSKNADLVRLQKEEGDKMLAAIPRQAMVIALDERGRSWSTQALSEQLDQWMHSGRSIALLVGGPEGLAPECKQQAEQMWSLSPLTLPHPLVRIVLAEQIYRAWSLLNNHPYHRA